MSNAGKIFGAGVKSVPKDAPPVPVEVRKDDQGIAFKLNIRRLPRLENQKAWDRISKAEQQATQMDDPEATLKHLLEAVKILTRPRGPKKKPSVIESMEGLTLANFKALVNDHQDYVGGIFDDMREKPELEFPHLITPEGETEAVPAILEYVLAQNGSVRLMVLAKLSEAIEEDVKKQEGNEPGSGSSSA